MELKLDYSVSEEIERVPIGYIKFLYSGETIDYFSEKEMLKDFKETIYSEGVNSVKYKLNRIKEKPRHGLQYELLKEEADEYGADYTKEEYEKSYIKSMIKRKENIQR